MRISGLFVYPIKSCAGTSLQQAQLTPHGLLHDRRWMLVNEQGKFVTQREQSRLALISPQVNDLSDTNSALTVHAPDMPELQVTPATDRVVTVKVWNDVLQAYDEGDSVAAWFSQFLDIPVRLVRFDDTVIRESARQWTGDLVAPNHFSDGFPMLLIGQSSLDDLNARLESPVPMNRFRPNLVVEGLPAYGEDSLRDFGTEQVQLRAVKPCTRCKITTTDQATGTVTGTQPLATLMQYRRNPQLRGVTFGQNVVLVSGGGVLSVGDTLRQA